jgi:hypothetical protein
MLADIIENELVFEGLGKEVRKSVLNILRKPRAKIERCKKHKIMSIVRDLVELEHKAGLWA